MIKGFSLFLAGLFMIATLKAQTFEWVKPSGGTGPDYGSSLDIDAFGNVYTTGYFSGTVDFDPGLGTTNLTSVGSIDIFVQKLDSSGNLLWAKSVGGPSLDAGVCIKADASGNVYIIGIFRDTADFDPGPGTANLISPGFTYNTFVLKLDSSGNFVWANSFQGTSENQGYSIDIDPSGNLYTTGIFKGIVDFDPGPGVANLNGGSAFHAFVHKMDSAGNYFWAKSVGGSTDVFSYSINVDGAGNAYTTGYFIGSKDFDPGPGTSLLNSSGGDDIFVQKLDSAGNFLWAKSVGGTGMERGLSIRLDNASNVYTTGFFSSTADFDPGPVTTNLTPTGATDVFVLKMDSLGTYVWAKSFGGSLANNDAGRSISLDALGNVYTAGTFSGTTDFDPGPGTTNITSAGNLDNFVQKLDGSGNFLWAIAYGGSGSEVVESITVDASANIFTIGSFEGTADFDPGAGISNLTSAGGTDIFVHKMSQCPPTFATDVITACDSFSWIDGNTYTMSNNTATFTLQNAAGCDSVVTLNLTMNYSSTGIDVITACNSFQWIDGNTYSTSNNSATFTLSNTVGCDSTVTLNLTVNQVSDTTTSLSGLTITANNANATYQWLDCDNNFALLAGETNQSFTATQNGGYAVELSEMGCVDTTACVSITSVGIYEFDKENRLTVYPNPSIGTVHITFDREPIEFELLLRDVRGKKILKQSYDAVSKAVLELPNTAGVYFLTIEANHKIRTIKLIRE